MLCIYKNNYLKPKDGGKHKIILYFGNIYANLKCNIISSCEFFDNNSYSHRKIMAKKKIK